MGRWTLQNLRNLNSEDPDMLTTDCWTRGPKGHCRSPEYNQGFKNLTSEWNQKQQHFILHVSRSLLCIRFVVITFWAEEVFEMCHILWWIGQGGNFYSLFGPKNTNLVEDVKILLPVKFRWIPFSGFRGKVKICLSQSEARAAILFFGSAQKHKLGRGRWELAFCQVSLNSVQWFHGGSRKCLSQSEDRVAILFFWSARKKQAW